MGYTAWYNCRITGKPIYCVGTFRTLSGAANFETSVNPHTVCRKTAHDFLSYFQKAGYETGQKAFDPLDERRAIRKPSSSLKKSIPRHQKNRKHKR